MAYIAATLGLVYIARVLSNRDEEEQIVEFYQSTPQPSQPHMDFDRNRESLVDTFTGSTGGVGVNPNQKVEQPSFGEVAFMKHVNGEPVRDFRNRPYVSGKMNNFGPIEKQMVGPGLNVGEDVPAYGGYQQLFRVRPNNVGAYRMTTLPGRSGPAGDVTGGRAPVIGQLTHYAPSKTAYLPSRYPNVKGRAQGQGGSLSGVTVRGDYQKTKRPTNRSETTLRGDGLEFAPAKKFISNETLAQDPTRNKGDLNVLTYGHVNNPTPGIHSFHGGYTNSPSVKAMSGGIPTNAQLEAHGLRPTDRRGNKDRAGNAGRMNVRADPLNQGGMITAVRSDTSRVDGRINAANGGWTQNYVQPMYNNFNAYKGNVNPRATTDFLQTAARQMESNPLAHNIAG